MYFWSLHYPRREKWIWSGFREIVLLSIFDMEKYDRWQESIELCFRMSQALMGQSQTTANLFCSEMHGMGNRCMWERKHSKPHEVIEYLSYSLSRLSQPRSLREYRYNYFHDFHMIEGNRRKCLLQNLGAIEIAFIRLRFRFNSINSTKYLFKNIYANEAYWDGNVLCEMATNYECERTERPQRETIKIFTRNAFERSWNLMKKM